MISLARCPPTPGYANHLYIKVGSGVQMVGGDKIHPPPEIFLEKINFLRNV